MSKIGLPEPAAKHFGFQKSRIQIVRVHNPRSCAFTAHMCTGMILSNYKLFVNPLFKLISIEHVIIGSG